MIFVSNSQVRACAVPLAFCWIFFVARPLTAGDWPQILGMHRNGVAVDENLGEVPQIPNEITWRHAVGEGYAGPAVVGDRVVVFHRVDDKERVEALEMDSGKPIWRQDFDAYYRPGVNPDTGPRCVPTIHDDVCVLFGAAGVAHAVNMKNGNRIWSRDLYADYQGRDGYFGAGSSPVVIHDRVLFNVGGTKAGVVALDLKTGKTAWATTNQGASYSSPITYSLDGKTYALFVTRLNAILIDVAVGNVVAQTPFGKRGPTVNAASPLAFEDRVFLTASYGVGAKLFQLRGNGFQPIWQNDTSLSSQYNTPVYFEGAIFGIHGREDLGTAALRCIAAKTGKVLWNQDDFGVAHLILAQKFLIALTIEGTAIVFDARQDRYREVSRAQVSQSTTRAIPALSNGRLVFRDMNALKCIRLR